MKLPGTFGHDEKTVNVIIETPAGSRNKYAYDPETGLFGLRKILPSGTEFPMNMGFIPGTKGEDGDPLDALVWVEFPTGIGTFIECRLIGVIEAEQKEKGKPKARNDRFVFVPECSREHEKIETIHDLPEEKLRDLEGFFRYYNKEEGKKFRVIGLKGPKKAMAVLKKQLT